MNYYFFRFLKAFSVFFVTVILFQACDFINPEEDIPAFVSIKEIKMSGKYGLGQKPVKIIDAWVFVDSKLIGAFELPAKFPVLSTGEHEISVQGGILINGIASTRSYYPFYSTYKQTVNLKENEELALENVNIAYLPITKFLFTETFDSTILQFDKTTTSDTNIIRTNDETIRYIDDGIYSGIIALDDYTKNFEILSSYNIKYSSNEVPIFLEMNYRAENEFSVGIYIMLSSSSSVRYEHIKIKPTAEWNKIYINFTPKLNEYNAPVYFKLFISGQKNSSSNQVKIVFDNIRLVTFS